MTEALVLALPNFDDEYMRDTVPLGLAWGQFSLNKNTQFAILVRNSAPAYLLLQHIWGSFVQFLLQSRSGELTSLAAN